MTLFHVSSLFAAFFAMSATQPQYVWQDLDKRSKFREKTTTAELAWNIWIKIVKNHYDSKSYQLRFKIGL